MSFILSSNMSSNMSSHDYNKIAMLSDLRSKELPGLHFGSDYIGPDAKVNCGDHKVATLQASLPNWALVLIITLNC